jgi:hypothetical protein
MKTSIATLFAGPIARLREARGFRCLAFAVAITLGGSASGRVSAQSGPAVEPRAVTCIALVLPSLQGSETSQAAASLRELIASFLTGPSLRTIALDARLPSQAFEEATQKSCGHLLTTTFAQKRGGSGGLGRVLGDAATGGAWHIPYGSSSAAWATRSAAMAGAHAAASIASNTRAKDEVRLEFRLSSSDGTLLRDGQHGRKAKADGEDLITPLVEQMAATVAGSIGRQR